MSEVILITLAQPNPEEQEALMHYLTESLEVGKKYNAEIISRFDVMEHLIGNRPSFIVGVAKLDSAETVKAMFESEEYKVLIPYREKAFKSINLYISHPNQSVAIEKDSEKAYQIVMGVPSDKEALGQYQQGAGPIAGKLGARPVAKVAIAETYMGDSPAAFMSIAEFANADDIKSFFSDEAYQPLVPLRDKALNELNVYIAN